MRKINDDRINIIVHPDFKQKIRIKATKEKMTITEVVTGLLEGWVKK